MELGHFQWLLYGSNQLKPEKSAGETFLLATQSVPSGQVTQRPDLFSRPSLEPWIIWGLTGQHPKAGKSTARAWKENICGHSP